MKRPLLQSRRLDLFVFQMDDLIDIYPCVTTTLTRYMAWEPARNFATQEKIGQDWLVKETKNTDRHFVLRSKQDQRFIGLIGVHRMQTSIPELGLWIREDCHHQGFAKEALFEVFQWASLHLSAEYFLYPVATENQPSRKLAEFLGGTVAAHKTEKKYDAVIYHIPPYQAKSN
ncbi:GNAT family N-acetyltransferase [Acinetobacter colistiniresistens]|uniref:GNAT family N-acetyltransferase n=1 Tax=Acinetobacter colistiniresistens TaxID=280145 RepID=UPI00211B9A8E|nr:GNAT family N-acetyltransferase [Acinetobacter colistiniresistens]UUM26205.1 GNAT family N-acetyltransferase [Acinetobacter colistiniresistens]